MESASPALAWEVFFFSLKATDSTWEAQAEGRAQKLQADEDGIRTQRTVD